MASISFGIPGRMNVLFSEFFKKSLGKIQSIQLRKTVITFLLKLASGWRPKKYIDVAYEDPLKLVKQYRVKGFIIVCTIDIMKYSEYIQVLKIWDILPSSDVPILVDRLSAFLKAYDYIDYCKMKHFEGKLEVPISWKNGFDIVQYRSHRRYMVARDPQDDPLDGRNYAENSKVSESLSVMKFYSLSSGVVHHLISGLDGKELDLPFELTDQEREIIRFPKSTFILGRSGTGKTTVLTVKLIQREQQHSLSVEGLCNLESYSSQGPNRKNKVNENAADTNKNKLRQLFVTVSPMLCSAIKNYVCRLKRFSLGGDFFADNDSDGMYDVDGGVMEPADISDSFVDVPSEKYPLVITFRKFLMMLDGSLTNSFFTRFYELKELPLNEKGYSFSPAFRSFIRQKEVNFERFTMVYWPHFNKQLTRKLDSSRVFKEIISHIKGGCAISEDCDGVLSRENYTILSEGRTSTINGEMRELIFDIFLDYEKMKLRRGDFDISDWVINLHRRLRAAGAHLGDKMDFVYVDEVQDLTLQQVALFKYVCNNLSDGFLFAGDTAQTVAKGIDFRFEDIKSMYYTEYLLKPSVGSSDKEKGKGKYISDLFHLTQNFRTHTGVLNLAQSVVKILYHYFPQSIDHLDPETSLIHGEAPVLIECGDDENAITTIFGGYGGDGNCNIAKCFGAEQVILVRDEASRKEISGCVGKQALVLTIIECKGLEFQDVLLYNFFGSSPLKGQWRVILDYMHSHKLLGSGHAKSFPGFEMTRHNVLCSELKQLYVAITRTRQRLWICESNTEYSKPMFEYWKSLSMVHATKLDGSIVHSMQVVSSKDEWRNRGYKLYKEGNFEQATFCFERAEDKYGEKCAYAAGLQDSAYRMLPMNSDKAQSSLIEAAEIYLTIGKPEEAAECYGLLVERGLSFIEHWKDNATSNDVTASSQNLVAMKDSFLERCISHYHEIKNKDSMLKFVKAFSSVEYARTFLRTRDYLEELFLVEEELGNFSQAANVAKLKGDLLLEANMLAKAENFEEASRLILFHVVVNSLWTSGSKGWPLKQFKGKNELLKRAELLAQKCSSCFCESVCIESDILSDNDHILSHLVKRMNSGLSKQTSPDSVFINLGAVGSRRDILDILMPSRHKNQSNGNICKG
ncbi:hypothetical protein Taro_035273, partial [Colocasia esculenta]|nr:hypothetical protein [Colocasia esculenta]